MMDSGILRSIVGVAAMSMVLAAPAAVRDYILGAGDQVQISVFPGDIPETVTRVSETGLISFPTLGQVRIGGLTERQAEAKIRKALADGQIVQSPQVVLLIQERVSHQVSVLGKIDKPGKYAITPGATVVDVLAEAGGITTDGSNEVVVTRQVKGGKKTMTVDIGSLLQLGEVNRNLELADNDIVYVPPKEVFYIYGEVANPGVYPLQKHMTVMQALSVSGGLSDRGTERGLKIKRRKANGSVDTVDARLEEVLRPDDVVFVKEGLF